MTLEEVPVGNKLLEWQNRRFLHRYRLKRPHFPKRVPLLCRQFPRYPQRHRVGRYLLRLLGKYSQDPKTVALRYLLILLILLTQRFLLPPLER